MFRFDRSKILPLFLCRQITINQLAKLAGVSFMTAQKAINGKPITAPVVQKIASALDVIATDFIAYETGGMTYENGMALFSGQ